MKLTNSSPINDCHTLHSVFVYEHQHMSPHQLVSYNLSNPVARNAEIMLKRYLYTKRTF